VTVLLADEDLDRQLQRTLTHAYERCADIGEALAAAARITPGDDDSWYAEWVATAARAHDLAEASRGAGRVETATEAFLRETEYYRQAMHYLRADLDDPRLKATYVEMREAFAHASVGMPFHVRRVRIPYSATTINGYLLTPDDNGAPYPTIVLILGYDAPAEDCYLHAAPALRRGYSVLAVEGPGQGGVLYEQGLHLRPDFEAVLTPVINFAALLPGVDPGRLVLIGRSLGGYLAPRGATTEHRLAALVCDPGQVDVGAAIRGLLPTSVLELVANNDAAADPILAALIGSPQGRRRWLPRMAAHGAATMREYLRGLSAFTLADRAADIDCPTLVLETEGDAAGGQSQQLFELLTCPKTLHRFAAADGATGQSGGLAQQVWNGYVFDWLDGVLAS
jgi:alpha-beta hydrolase superfamily lysophospholipase